MSIDIPPELQWISYLAGSAWPKGDEDGLWRLSDHWNGAAKEMTDLIPDLNRVRNETTSVLTGETADTAQQEFAKLFDGDYSVDKLVQAMSALGEMAKEAGTQVEASKLEILVGLAMAAGEILYAIAMAPETFGASMAWVPPIEAITMAAIRTLFNQLLRMLVRKAIESLTKTAVARLIREVAQEAAEEVAEELITNLAIQGYQVSQGHKDGIDGGDLADAAKGAAAGGAAAGLFHGPAFAALGGKHGEGGIGNALAGAGAGYGTEVVAGVAGALAVGGDLNAGEILAGGALGGLSGGIESSHGHGAGEHGPGGGAGDGGMDGHSRAFGPDGIKSGPDDGPNNDSLGASPKENGSGPSQSNGSGPEDKESSQGPKDSSTHSNDSDSSRTTATGARQQGDTGSGSGQGGGSGNASNSGNGDASGHGNGLGGGDASGHGNGQGGGDAGGHNGGASEAGGHNGGASDAGGHNGGSGDASGHGNARGGGDAGGHNGGASDAGGHNGGSGDASGHGNARGGGDAGGHNGGSGEASGHNGVSSHQTFGQDSPSDSHAASNDHGQQSAPQHITADPASGQSDRGSAPFESSTPPAHADTSPPVSQSPGDGPPQSSTTDHQSANQSASPNEASPADRVFGNGAPATDGSRHLDVPPDDHSSHGGSSSDANGSVAGQPTPPNPTTMDTPAAASTAATGVASTAGTHSINGIQSTGSPPPAGLPSTTTSPSSSPVAANTQAPPSATPSSNSAVPAGPDVSAKPASAGLGTSNSTPTAVSNVAGTTAPAAGSRSTNNEQPRSTGEGQPPSTGDEQPGVVVGMVPVPTTPPTDASAKSRHGAAKRGPARSQSLPESTPHEGVSSEQDSRNDPNSGPDPDQRDEGAPPEETNDDQPPANDERDSSRSPNESPSVTNSKYDDLVDGAASTPRPTKENYLEQYLKPSVDDGRELSFVVNMIAPHTDIHELPDVVKKIMEGADGFDGKVAFVVGVNALDSPQGRAELNTKLNDPDFQAKLNDLDHPVAVIGSFFTADDGFKHGVERNNVLHSEANKSVVNAMMANETHPYVAIQDFDHGDRRTPSGKHIFNYVSDELNIDDWNFGDDDQSDGGQSDGGQSDGGQSDGDQATDSTGGWPPSRPLKFSGGYRVPQDFVQSVEALVPKLVEAKQRDANAKDADAAAAVGTDAAHEKSEAAKNAHTAAKTAEKNEAKFNDGDKEAFVKNFTRKINQDMESRDRQAKNHPSQPYSPEPNLFVDAVAPMVDENVRFQPAGGEARGLDESLARFNADELDKLHPAPAQTFIGPKTFEQTFKDDREQRSALHVDADTGRHPIRGESFVARFKEGAIATDLGRLGAHFAIDGSVPQTHATLGHARGGLLQDPFKAGDAYQEFRKQFPNLPGVGREPTTLSTGGEPASSSANQGSNDARPTFAPSDKTKGHLGLNPDKPPRYNTAVSAPIPASTFHAGIDPTDSQAVASAAVNTVQSGPAASIQRFFGQLANLADLHAESTESPNQTAFHSPPGDHGLFHAVSDTAGTALNKSPSELRHDFVAGMAGSGGVRNGDQLADFMTTNPTHGGDLAVSVMQPATPLEPRSHVSPDDVNTAINAEHFVAKALAAHLQANIVVHTDDNKKITYAPPSKRKDGAAHDEVHVEHDDNPDNPGIDQNRKVNNAVGHDIRSIHVDATQQPNGRRVYTARPPAAPKAPSSTTAPVTAADPPPPRNPTKAGADNDAAHDNDAARDNAPAHEASGTTDTQAPQRESNTASGLGRDAGNAAVERAAKEFLDIKEPPTQRPLYGSIDARLAAHKAGDAPDGATNERSPDPRRDGRGQPVVGDSAADSTVRARVDADPADRSGPPVPVAQRVGPSAQDFENAVDAVVPPGREVSAADCVPLMRSLVEKLYGGAVAPLHSVDDAAIRRGGVGAAQDQIVAGGGWAPVHGVAGVSELAAESKVGSTVVVMTTPVKKGDMGHLVAGRVTDTGVQWADPQREEWIRPEPPVEVQTAASVSAVVIDPDGRVQDPQAWPTTRTSWGASVSAQLSPTADALLDKDLTRRFGAYHGHPAQSRPVPPTPVSETPGPSVSGTPAPAFTSSTEPHATSELAENVQDDDPGQARDDDQPSAKRKRDSNEPDSANVGDTKRSRNDAPDAIADGDAEMVDALTDGHVAMADAGGDAEMTDARTDGDVETADAPASSESLEEALDRLELAGPNNFNARFENFVQGVSADPISSEMQKDHLEKSVRNNKPISFVVNAILPVSDVGRVPAVVAAITRDLSEDQKRRVAFVFGVNAQTKETDASDAGAELQGTLDSMKDQLEGIGYPVALVGSTFTGVFQPGIERNKTMRSEASRLAVAAMVEHGDHPYLSIQDFDEGSRTIPSEEHFFDEDSRTIRPKKHVYDHLNEQMTENPIRSRPLMVGGGYRVPADQTALRDETKKRLEKHLEEQKVKRDELRTSQEVLQGQLVAIESANNASRERRRVQQALDKAQEQLNKEQGKMKEAQETLDKIVSEEFWDDFDLRIDMDMDTRDELAKTSPLWPYTPEPNLFVDAMPVMETGSEIEFGDGKAEFGKLSKSLATRYAQEVSTDVDPADAKKASPSGQQTSTDGHPPEAKHAEQVEGAEAEEAEVEGAAAKEAPVRVAAQNLRHSVRGEAFSTNFRDMAIETDLSRLAAKYALENDLPQSHVPLKFPVDRLFDGKGDKTGNSVVSYVENYPKLRLETRDPLRIREAVIQQRSHAAPDEAINKGASLPPAEAETVADFDPGASTKHTKQLRPAERKKKAKRVGELGKAALARQRSADPNTTAEPLSADDERRRVNELGEIEVHRELLGAATPADAYSPAVSAPVPDTDARAGIDTSSLDQRMATATNAALSAPVPLMQRHFGQWLNSATFEGPLSRGESLPPPAAGSLFDVAAKAKSVDPTRLRTETLTLVATSALTERQQKSLAATITRNKTTGAERTRSLLWSQPRFTGKELKERKDQFKEKAYKERERFLTSAQQAVARAEDALAQAQAEDKAQAQEAVAQAKKATEDVEAWATAVGALAEAEEGLAQAENALAQAEADDQAQDKAQAEGAVAEAEKAVDLAEAVLAEKAKPVAQARAKVGLARAEGAVAEAEKGLVRAEKGLVRAQADDQAQAEEALAEAEKAVKRAELDVEWAKILLRSAMGEHDPHDLSENSDAEEIDPLDQRNLTPPPPDAAFKASQIAVTALAMQLNQPIEVTYTKGPKNRTNTFHPLTPDGGKKDPLKLEAHLNDDGDIVYTHIPHWSEFKGLVAGLTDDFNPVGDRFGGDDSGGDDRGVLSPGVVPRSVLPRSGQSRVEVESWVKDVNNDGDVNKDGDVNGGGDRLVTSAAEEEEKRSTNCGPTTWAVFDRLSGTPSFGRAHAVMLSAEHVGAVTGLPLRASDPGAIEAGLRGSGVGAHTVVVAKFGNGGAHSFNVLFDGDGVWAIDGQKGKVDAWPPALDRPGIPVTGWLVGTPVPSPSGEGVASGEVDGVGAMMVHGLGDPHGDSSPGSTSTVEPHATSRPDTTIREPRAEAASNPEGSHLQRRDEGGGWATAEAPARDEAGERSGASVSARLSPMVDARTDPTRLFGAHQDRPAKPPAGSPNASAAHDRADAPVTVTPQTPKLSAPSGQNVVLSGMDVVETFKAGNESLDQIRQLVIDHGGQQVWEDNRERLTALFEDDGLQPKVPGMLRGGKPVSDVVELGFGQTLSIDLRVDGSPEVSSLQFKENVDKYEFEHSADPSSFVGSFDEGRRIYLGGAQARLTHANASYAANALGAREHQWSKSNQRTYRQISGGQTTEPGTRRAGHVQGVVSYRVSGPVNRLTGSTSTGGTLPPVSFHTVVVSPTRAITDAANPAPASSAPPRMSESRALTGSDVVTNLQLLPDGTGSPHGPRFTTDFVTSAAMRTAFESAYGKDADRAMNEVDHWLSVELLQANLHGMTNKQPLMHHFDGLGGWVEVHAFVESLGTPSDTKPTFGEQPANSADPQIRATGETALTEFHYGTETDSAQVRQDQINYAASLPLPGHFRADGGTAAGEGVGGLDGGMNLGRSTNETTSSQLRNRSTSKNPVAGQALNGQVRLRFVMHTPGSISPSQRDGAFKDAVVETRAQFDALIEASANTPTTDYRNTTVYAPPKRIWGRTDPQGERNSTTRRSRWQKVTGTYPAAATNDSSPSRDQELTGLGSMDRVDNLDLSGFHGMLKSMGHKAFGGEWKDVEATVMADNQMQTIRSGLPGMTQHSPFTSIELSGPGSATKLSLTADIENLTFLHTIDDVLSSPSMESTEGSATTTVSTKQISEQGALGGHGGSAADSQVLGEAIAGASETVRDGHRVRAQQRMVVATKFHQPMAVFEGWVRIDGTMTGSKATVHESGLFPVRVAIPLTELQGSRTHDDVRPPTFDRSNPAGRVEAPRRTPASASPAVTSTAAQPASLSAAERGKQIAEDAYTNNPGSPKRSWPSGAQTKATPAPPPPTADSRPLDDMADRAPGETRTNTANSPDTGSETAEPRQAPPSWTPPYVDDDPPAPPTHALRETWQPTDMLVGLDPAASLSKAIRSDLAPALGEDLDKAMVGVDQIFGAQVLQARVAHQSGREWSHDVPVAGGTIKVKVRAIREASATYVGPSAKFETDVSVESQSSTAHQHDGLTRHVEGARLVIPAPHSSASIQVTHSGSILPKDAPSASGGHDGAEHPNLSTPRAETTLTDTEQRAPVRVKSTEAHNLFRQPIRFEITYEKHLLARRLTSVPDKGEDVRMAGVFSYPAATPVDVADASDLLIADPTGPGISLAIDQLVTEVRPPGRGAEPNTAAAEAGPGQPSTNRTPTEDAMATHVLDSMTEEGLEVFGKDWPAVRAELADHVNTAKLHGGLGDYARGTQTVIDLESVRGGKVVLSGRVDAMTAPQTGAAKDAEFYTGGQTIRTTVDTNTNTNNWQAVIQGRGTALPADVGVNASLLGRFDVSRAADSSDTRTGSSATGEVFRKKAAATTQSGRATVRARMSRPAGILGGEPPPVRDAAAQIEFRARQGTKDESQRRYEPRLGTLAEGRTAAPRTAGNASADTALDTTPDMVAPHDRHQVGLPEGSMVRKIVDGAAFRRHTLENLVPPISGIAASRLRDNAPAALSDTALQRHLPAMTHGQDVELFRDGSLRITGRADITGLDFVDEEKTGGMTNRLNEVTQGESHQDSVAWEAGPRFMAGPHGNLGDALTGSIMVGGGVLGRSRHGVSYGQSAKVSANAKFAGSHAVFDGTANVVLTIHDGDTTHTLPGVDVHGPMLIPTSQVDAVETPPAPTTTIAPSGTPRAPRPPRTPAERSSDIGGAGLSTAPSTGQPAGMPVARGGRLRRLFDGVRGTEPNPPRRAVSHQHTREPRVSDTPGEATYEIELTDFGADSSLQEAFDDAMARLREESRGGDGRTD